MLLASCKSHSIRGKIQPLCTPPSGELASLGMANEVPEARVRIMDSDMGWSAVSGHGGTDYRAAASGGVSRSATADSQPQSASQG